jgi:hypothetical protein
MPEKVVFLVVPCFLWASFRVFLPNVTVDLDFDVSHATFILIYDRLYNIAWWMMIAGVVTALYGRHEHVPAIVSEMCLFGSVFALLFVVYLLLCYQTYLHARYPRNGTIGSSVYTVNQYAWTNALGFSALIFFVLGVICTVGSIA